MDTNELNEIKKTLGISIEVPKKAKKFWGINAIFTNLVNTETLNENLKNWEILAKYRGKAQWDQLITKKEMGRFTCLAMSTDLIAGVNSESYFGYMIIKTKEYNEIEQQITKLARQKENGIHLSIIWSLKQGYTGKKAYLNFFNSIECNDCEDDGRMVYLTPKRNIPRDLFSQLHFVKFNWDTYEYSKNDLGGSQWIIILQREFERVDIEQKLAEINTTIEQFMEKQLKGEI